MAPAPTTNHFCLANFCWKSFPKTATCPSYLELVGAQLSSVKAEQSSGKHSSASKYNHWKIGMNFPLQAFVTQFAKLCGGELSPMCAAMGGIVAQEVIKACSGKFMPIFQWLYFDALECLPDDCSALSEESCAPTNSRYDR